MNPWLKHVNSKKVCEPISYSDGLAFGVKEHIFGASQVSRRYLDQESTGYGLDCGKDIQIKTNIFPVIYGYLTNKNVYLF